VPLAKAKGSLPYGSRGPKLNAPETLKDVALRDTYDSDSDDTLGEFFIPVLGAATKYHRLAGFFSSSVLAVAARGMSRFIRNGGKMELLCCARLTKRDVEAISGAVVDPNRIISESSIRELSTLEDAFVRDHVAALAWMVANGRLEIKVALVLDENGVPLDSTAVDDEALFHQKVGILEDAEGNSLSFSGSDNESAKGWMRHVEEFKVFRAWEPAERHYYDSDVRKFEKFWKGAGERTLVLDIPEALRKKLIDLAPSDVSSLNLEKWSARTRNNTRAVRLWPHQLEAVDKWVAHDKRGIFAMATGTGKTQAALECLRRTLTESSSLLTVLAMPYSHLLRQWESEYERSGIQVPSVVVDSSNQDWRNQVADRLLDLENGSLKSLIIFTTHDSLGAIPLQKLLGERKIPQIKRLLIVDEVHGVGSQERRHGLLNSYDYRLGLSATPERYFDEEGSAVIAEFFGGEIYAFSLRQAIDTRNPATGESFLTPYIYRPRTTELTPTELQKYSQLTDHISRLYHPAQKDPELEKTLLRLYFNRQDILNNAASKLPALESILRELSPVQHCLIYCSPQQKVPIQRLLNRLGIAQHKFTLEEGVTPSEKYGGISEREFLLQEFTRGTYQALVAMKCLDEGVDVPQAAIGILVSSTGNPREFIQRRGRLLRRFPGKDRAVIYDLICVVPRDKAAGQGTYGEEESKIRRKETARYLEFARDATNSVDCLNLLYSSFDEAKGA
jgi:superfamily II DNA or RNA helicase